MYNKIIILLFFQEFLPISIIFKNEGTGMDRKAESGFTLVEVLASIVILGIILTTFFGFFSQSLLFSSKNEEDLQAINLARKTLVVLQQLKKVNLSGDTLLLQATSEFSIEEEIPHVYFIEDKNNKKYYIEAKDISRNFSKSQQLEITKQSIIPVQVRIYQGYPYSEDTLLSETFGYIKDVSK
jgi:prepilin-type N-terminal cleavage/methylation domain-containing protein